MPSAPWPGFTRQPDCTLRSAIGTGLAHAIRRGCRAGPDLPPLLPIQLPAVGSAEAVGDNRLQTVRDSGGFDPQLYEIQVPAGGSPRATKEVVEALQNTSLRVTTDARRGLDHGAWVPLRDLFPAAEVPVAPLSIQHLGGRAGPSPGRARRHPRSCHRHGQSCL